MTVLLDGFLVTRASVDEVVHRSYELTCPRTGSWEDGAKNKRRPEGGEVSETANSGWGLGRTRGTTKYERTK